MDEVSHSNEISTQETLFDKNKETKSENFLVFVYGTLKINEPNYDQMTNPALGKATYVGIGKTVKKWPLVIASRFNIPFLLYKEGEGKNIIGEIFEVDKKMLLHMDEFEGHPSYYTRIPVEVEFLKKDQDPTQRIITPWAYFLKNFRPQLLELPYLESYCSKDSHGLEYITRYNRLQGQDYYNDVKIS